MEDMATADMGMVATVTAGMVDTADMGMEAMVATVGMATVTQGMAIRIMVMTRMVMGMAPRDSSAPTTAPRWPQGKVVR